MKIYLNFARISSSTIFSKKTRFCLKKVLITVNGGEYGDKFYIVLKGSVNVLRKTEKETEMSFEEYITFLEELRYKQEFFLLTATIQVNKDKFPFALSKSTKEIANIRQNIKIRNTIEIVDEDTFSSENLIKKEKSEKLEDPQKKKKQPIKKLKIIDEDFHFSNDKNFIEAEKAIKELRSLMFSNREKRFKVTIFENRHVLNLERGSYFGDIALDSKSMFRTATIIGNEDTHLGFIDSKEYNDFVLKHKKLLELNEVDNLLTNFFNHATDRYYFLSNYYPYFKSEEKKRGDLLFNEGEDLNYIYLIIEGEVEYLINSSLINLGQLIRQLYNKLNLEYSASKHEKVLFIKHKSSFEMTNIRTFRVLTSNSIIGLDEYFLKIPKYFKARVHSKVLKYYAVPIEIFDKIVRSDKSLYSSFGNLNFTKFSIFLNRINDIKDIHLDLEIKKLEQRILELREMRCQEKFQSNIEIRSVSKNLANSITFRNEAIPINCKKLSTALQERRSSSIPQKIILRSEKKVLNKSDSKNSIVFNMAYLKKNDIREVEESSGSFDSEKEENHASKMNRENLNFRMESSEKGEIFWKLTCKDKKGEIFKKIHVNKNSKLNEIFEKFNKKQ